MNTAYTITTNTTYNSTEISFDGKPSEEIRDTLKSMRFRWHGQRRVWYGYKDEETVRAALEGKTTAGLVKHDRADKTTKPEKLANKFGVQVGDIFSASWGYEQTQTDFFQVVELVGALSVRVREVNPPIVRSTAVSPMSEDRVYQLSRDILPPASHSVFIDDQERGDLKRLKSYAADGVSNPQFNLSSFANAYYCAPGECKAYESWYY